MYWIATYKDGTTLNSKHGGRYQDIRREDLNYFSLVNNNAVIYTLWLDPGQRLIYRRRVFTTTDGEETVWYLIGWQQTLSVAIRSPDDDGHPVTISQHNVQSVAYISDDGLRVNLAGRFREDHPLFYGIKPMPGEE